MPAGKSVRLKARFMLLRLKYLFLLLTPLLLLHAAALAQSSTSTSQQDASLSNTQSAGMPVFNVTTRAVVLDVVAEDKRKLPVRGLTKDDFHLTEDGQPEEIASFEAIESQPNVSPREPSGLPHTVVLIDEMNTRFQDLAYARYSMQKLLSASKSLDDPTALFALTNKGLIGSAGLHPRSEPTKDCARTPSSGYPMAAQSASRGLRRAHQHLLPQPAFHRHR